MIIHIVNSHLTRNGNFGVRAKRICDALAKQNIAFYCMSRGGGDNHRYHNFYIFGYVARLFNWLKLKLLRNFNHRKYDRLIFETLVLIKLRNLQIEGSIIHLWEYSSRIINYAQSRGAKVFLEVPNVTQNYICKLKAKEPHLSLSFFDQQMHAEKEAIERADLVIVPSDFVKINAIELAPKAKCILIPFGFPEVGSKNSLSDTKKVLRILFVGNVDERKGIPTLVEALQFVPDLMCEVIILGRLGSLKRSFFQHDKRIRYLGFKNPVDYYQWADVFVFPSWCEGSAKVIYEAMSSGLAVITTHSAGSLIAHNVDGMLIEAGDSLRLGSILLKMSKNPQIIRDLGEAAMITAQKRPWIKYTEDIIKTYGQYL